MQTSLKEAHSVALVHHHHQSSHYYLLITPTKTTSNFCSYQRRTRTKLEELGATIKWIRPFDRHLQRLFGWGDAWSKEVINSRADDDDQRVAWKGDGLFYVHNSKSMRNDLKVEWLRDEIGNNNASLSEFAATYLRLFGDTNLKQSLRNGCLKLYRDYNEAFTARRECELPPAELEAFQRVFDSAAPSRCRCCSRRVPKGSDFCNQACAEDSSERWSKRQRA